MNPDQAQAIVLNTALATLFTVVALPAVTAAARWRTGRVVAVLLAWAMAQHAINQLASAPILAALGIPQDAGT